MFLARCLVLLLMFSKNGKLIITYGLMVYGGTARTSFDMLEKTQQRILRATFLKKRCDSVSNMYERHLIFSAHEMYAAEPVRYLFRQLRGKSLFDSTSGYYIPADVNNRIRKKFFIKSSLSNFSPTTFVEKLNRQIINLVTLSN